MYEYLRSTFGENSWLLAVATVAFFTIKGLLWIVIPMIALRWFLPWKAFRKRFE